MYAPRQFVDAAPQTRLGYLRSGHGPPVVLIHGAVSRADDMASGLFPILAPQFDVIAFDRPGYGTQGADARGGTCWAQAERIRGACLGLGLDAPVLVGHSFGGAVAMAYALLYPEQTAGVIALAPLVTPEPRLEHFVFAPRAPDGLGDVLNAAAAGLDQLLMPILWRAMFLPQRPTAAFMESFPFAEAASRADLKAAGQEAALLGLGLAGLVEALPRLNRPLRILAGDGDIVVNNRLHGQLAALLAPDGDFRLLPGLGHMLHHFAQEQILEAVRALHDPPALRQAS